MDSRTFHGLSYFLVATLFFTQTAAALPPVPQSPMTQPAGRVSAIIPAATRNDAGLAAQDQLFNNDLLKTEAAGRVRVGLTDGSIISLGSNSQLRIIQHDASTRQTSLELTFGRVRSYVQGITSGTGKYEVRTPTAIAGVIGTDFEVIATANRTEVRVFSGKVSVTALNGVAQPVTVGQGQGVSVTPAGISQPYAVSIADALEDIGQATTTTTTTGAVTGAAAAGVSPGATSGAVVASGVSTAASAAAAASGVSAAAGAAAATISTRNPPSRASNTSPSSTTTTGPQ